MALLSLVPTSVSKELAFHDPRWRSKSLLQLANLILAIVAVILFGIAIPLWDGEFFHDRGPSRGDWTDGFPIAPLSIVVMFSALSIANTFARRRRLPPLPSIITYITILILLLVATVFAGVGGVFPYWQEPRRGSGGQVICSSLNQFTRECEPLLYRIGELQIAAIIFSIVVWLNTTLLFLMAIQEWRELKATKKHQLRKLQLYSTDLEKGGRTGQRISLRRPAPRMSFLQPPAKARFSRYSTQHKTSVESVGTTVPFVFVTDEEPSYPPPIRFR
jgi:hypothetical protein